MLARSVARDATSFLALAASLSVIGVAAAATASAATIDVTVDCSTGHDTRPVGNLAAESGHTLVFAGAACGFGSSYDSAGIFTSYASQDYRADGPWLFVISGDAPASLYGSDVTLYIIVDNNVSGSGTTSVFSGQYYTLTITRPADGVPVNPPWLQAVGRGSSTGACADGWVPSYAQWPNGGSGGYVCEFVRPTYGP